MEIDDLIGPASILPGLKSRSKRQVLQDLSAHAAELIGMPERTLFDILTERERLGTTGVGQGVAIPHGKVPSLDKVFGLFARTNEPIDFESMDDRPVDLYFLLLAPEGAGADHLKALARVSRLFRDKALCEKLRGAEGGDALHALLLRKAAAA
ncbi:PTS IIA-like nitrogen-regulatory protein PtsN [Iodidimonas nitroreducens]|uniref:PTS IIA-like nitrogen-regulatory protein PtsN n=1 Tax=Iodidimonas nitroreducens TaxID=1236968 RepID=A0A5A7NCZ8_9PROT|nr:PTS sugar transporter subunit IIA [Iodidimonas nitroreducens]GAK32715.1 nitrogen regulatory protein [alpha proteobacterium Q-1]GER04949.1 PTS IIA-like nitrogen-regulatory protein PtsN [Iodidimonas nitroreducens]